MAHWRRPPAAELPVSCGSAPTPATCSWQRSVQRALRSASATASSRTDGEDELAGTGLSLVIDGVNHLQITTRLVPAPELPAQALVARLCSGPAHVGPGQLTGPYVRLRLLASPSIPPSPCWDPPPDVPGPRPGRTRDRERLD